MRPISDPGEYSGLHAELGETILNIKHGIWSGFKVNYTRNVSRNVQASHSFTYGSTDEHQPDGYQFNPTYVGTYKPDPTDPNAYPVVVSNLDPSTGTLMTTLVHAFTPQMKCVFRAQSRAKADWVGSELTGTYTGSDWVGTLTAANVAPEKKEGTMVLSYLQKVSKNWSFGGDFLYQAAEGHVGAVMGFGGRYRDETCSASIEASSGKGSLQLGYFHRLDEQTHLGAEFEANAMSGAVTSTLGYTRQFRGANLKGAFNTNGEAACMVEKEVFGPFMLKLGGVMDHYNSKYKFCLGFDMMM